MKGFPAIKKNVGNIFPELFTLKLPILETGRVGLIHSRQTDPCTFETSYLPIHNGFFTRNLYSHSQGCYKGSNLLMTITSILV
jgi:hypothetical protein